MVSVFVPLFLFGQSRFPSQGVGFKVLPDLADADAVPVFESQIISKVHDSEVHSPTLVPLANGSMCAFWYGGEREGSWDTVIYSANFDPASGKWSDGRAVIDRETTQEHVRRFVKKLGNAVALRDARGQIWLFYVSSMWGWSGSSINLICSSDEGATWTEARRIVTSPFMNYSTLVRGHPFLFADGTIGLPIYHEFIGKFCELLRLDETGRVIHKQRITHARTSLQSVIVPITPSRAICAMRPGGTSPRQLLLSRTQDGGRTWSPTETSAVYSDYSGNAMLRIGNDDLLTITRADEKLIFYISKDGGITWGKSFELDHAVDAHLSEGRHGPSYPCLMQTPDGDYHLVYSLERVEIRHIRFNQRWLEMRN
jgi:predicted neuraminidase